METKVKDTELATEVAEVEKAGSQTGEARRVIRELVERRYTVPG